MSDLLWIVLSCAFLGCFVGFLAGLLGIGGGLIIVPFLSAILVHFNLVVIEQVMVIAIATSLASIIFTSSSSALAHHKNSNIPWNIMPWIMIGVALGALISGFVAGSIPAQTLKVIFALCVSIIALRMLLNFQQKSHRRLPQKNILTLMTTGLGGLSGLLGIGGGALLVPLLTYFSVNMKKAIGCSAACGIIIALFGTFGYISSGWSVTNLNQGFLGYVYLPALLAIVSTSAIFAQLGAKATQYLPVKIIKKIFAVILSIIAIRMLVV
ncbi:sulfite exporter TauE/SafE family protein [Pseudoalteromonas denitrificans]|uniref:Probable membrane transporter protein n=1 Tax=Pseudoalteromonas denitrificans DSM 6059 TaxID=1123010 RepID=A0A1I1SGS2_9GAMM|nr:sulfite exporter TauE/SafE family protein [Pseudoalteromonas denitrificans]SFD43838.1 Uncharacterized membrane protein YfcA [Pseudoalteromonas denitrificans DSM 6059]